jgi:hypothetical protein
MDSSTEERSIDHRRISDACRQDQKSKQQLREPVYQKQAEQNAKSDFKRHEDRAEVVRIPIGDRRTEHIV